MAGVARTLRGTLVARRAAPGREGREDADPSAGGFHGYMSYTTKSHDIAGGSPDGAGRVARVPLAG